MKYYKIILCYLSVSLCGCTTDAGIVNSGFSEAEKANVIQLENEFCGKFNSSVEKEAKAKLFVYLKSGEVHEIIKFGTLDETYEYYIETPTVQFPNRVNLKYLSYLKHQNGTCGFIQLEKISEYQVSSMFMPYGVTLRNGQQYQLAPGQVWPFYRKYGNSYDYESTITYVYKNTIDNLNREFTADRDIIEKIISK